MKTKLVLDVEDSPNVLDLRDEYKRKLENVHSAGSAGYINCLASFDRVLMALLEEAFELGLKSKQ